MRTLVTDVPPFCAALGFGRIYWQVPSTAVFYNCLFLTIFIVFGMLETHFLACIAREAKIIDNLLKLPSSLTADNSSSLLVFGNVMVWCVSIS